MKWELDYPNNNSQNISKKISGGWELDYPENNVNDESLLASLGLAIPRVASDIGHALYSGYQKLPEYYQKGKAELAGLPSTISQHPGHAAMQALAGSQEAINDVAQAPYNLGQYASNRLNLLPQSVAKKIPHPQDTTNAINQLFGKTKYPGEELLRGTVRDLPGIGIAAKGAQLLKPVTNKSIAKSIQSTHDVLENEAQSGFKDVAQQAYERGIDKIPKNELIDLDEIKEYFPSRTKTVKKLFEDAKKGDYTALRKIQADLYTKGKNSLKSDLNEERSRGEEMLERRDDINKAIQNHFMLTGNHDLAETLNNSRRNWATLQKTYYNKNMPQSIQKLVDQDIRKVPTNLVKILGENSKPMKQLREFHPGLESKLTKHGFQKKSEKLLKYGLPALGLYEGYNIYKDKNFER